MLLWRRSLGLFTVTLVCAAAAPMAASAAGWVSAPIATPSQGRNPQLQSVSCTSTTVCIAVGVYSTNTSTTGYSTLAERWNGSRWSVMTTPRVPAVNDGGKDVYHQPGLYGVSCTSASACSAVGNYYDSAGKIVVLAERFNGTKWSVQPTPAPAPDAALLSVSCHAGGCLAVGTTNPFAGFGPDVRSVAERYNGSTWSVAPAPLTPPGTTIFSELFSVKCPGATSCTAVGTYETGSGVFALAERFNGSTWSLQHVPTAPGASAPELSSVGCPVATACTAVGSDDKTAAAGTGVGIVDRWNGSSWSTQQLANPPGTSEVGLTGVSCSSATLCTAVGEDRNTFSSAVAERLNGSSASATVFKQAYLTSISCLSGGFCMAVGDTSERYP